jgi:hypothetical protein
MPSADKGEDFHALDRDMMAATKTVVGSARTPGMQEYTIRLLFWSIILGVIPPQGLRLHLA